MNEEGLDSPACLLPGTEAPSSVFFGLRSGVELFADPRSAQAVTRAKEAAVLYDRVIFEVGLLDVVVGPGGSTSFWTPPERISDEKRARARIPIELGAPFTLSFGAQPGPGAPAEPDDMVTLVDTNVSLGFVAEYHSGILDETAPLELDWIDVAHTPSSLPARDPIGESIQRANWRDSSDKELLRDRPHFERDLIFESFNHDSAFASAFGAALTVTPLFEPIIDRRGLRIDHPGDEALRILISNLGRLPWEAVAEFREHPGCQEARTRLREFERRAAEDEPGDALAFLRTIAQDVTRTYMQAFQDQRPKLSEKLAKEAIKTGVSLVPGVGPMVEKVATVTQLAAEVRQERRSWTSAIFKLAEYPDRDR